MKKQARWIAALLLTAMLAGCAQTAPAATAATAAPAGTGTAVQTAGPTPTGAGQDPQPTPPSTEPDRSGYFEYAQLFFDTLKKGDAFETSAFLYFADEEQRAEWMDRFAAPINAKLLSVSSVARNLWAVTVEEELGSELPPTQTDYYIAWYDGSYRIFTDLFSLPEDLIRDQDFSGMPLPELPKTDGKKNPGEDEFPPEDGQAEKWYREQQAELAAVKAAAEKAVRTLPEADTVTSFENAKVDLVDASKVEFLTARPQGSQLLLYRVSFPTKADAILGPITVYLDSEANVLGFGPRE